MSWFNRKQKKGGISLDTLRKISTMSAFVNSGLLFIDVKEHRVVIHETLATYYMRNHDSWRNFLGNVYVWFVYQVSQMQWRKHFLDVELKAVQEAKKKCAFITALQERDIRLQARMKVDLDAVKLPAIESYTFIVSGAYHEGENPLVYAVGNYKNGCFDMFSLPELGL